MARRSETSLPSQGGAPGGAPGLSEDDEPIVFYTPPGSKRARPVEDAAVAQKLSTCADGVGFKLLTVVLPGRDGEVANRNAISMRDIVQVGVAPGVAPTYV